MAARSDWEMITIFGVDPGLVGKFGYFYHRRENEERRINMADLTLYIGDKTFSSWSLRPWLALKQAGNGFQEVMIALGTPDTRRQILAHSPTGRVPVLKHGDVTVWESLAICEYLNDLFPAARLWPADPTARATAAMSSVEAHTGCCVNDRNSSTASIMPLSVRFVPRYMPNSFMR